MISKKLHPELNSQIATELESAYAYWAIAAYFDTRSLDGFAHWMNIQAQEEMSHAMKIYKFLSDLGLKFTPLALSQPKYDFSSVEDACQEALKNEIKLFERFNKLSSLAMEEKDNTTYTFLEWFITEQVEEVASCTSLLDKVKLAGESGQGLLLLDRELASRSPEEGAS